MAEKDQFNLKSMSREQREAHKDSFFRLYRKTKCVKQAAELTGISLKTATTWVRAYKDNGNKVKREGKRGPEQGRDRILSDEQLAKLCEMLVDKDPRQYKLKFALWNAKAIKQLIEHVFHVKIAARTVRLYMKMLGFTPQRPEKRAREQNVQAVKEWVERKYPSISRVVKNLGYTIYWGDETGISTRETCMRGYAPKGQTPCIDVTSVVSCRVNMISAVSNRGDLHFKLYRGSLSVLKYIRFLNALCKTSDNKVILIVDNLRVHHSKIVKRWLRKHHAKIHVFYLPSYSPELNPDELVNSDLKRAISQREPAENRDELEQQMREHMETNQANKAKMANLFGKKSVSYANQ